MLSRQEILLKLKAVKTALAIFNRDLELLASYQPFFEDNIQELIRDNKITLYGMKDIDYSADDEELYRIYLELEKKNICNMTKWGESVEKIIDQKGNEA